jgi:hypothetical protein
MNAIQLQVTFNNEDELSIFEALFEKFKIKTKVLHKEKKLNNYSDRTAERIERGREQKQKGTLTTITPENIWTLTN